MKKILLIFLVTFVMLIPNVKADESVLSCSKSANLFDEKFIQGGSRSNSGYVFENDLKFFVTSESFIKVSPNKYYFSSNYLIGRLEFYIFDSDFNYLLYFMTSSSNFLVDLTSVSNASYLKIQPYLYKGLNPNSFTNNWAQLELGEVATSYVPYEACSSVEPTPETDTTLTSFYNIYLNKLGMLADFTTENKYFSYFIGIILLFICLEIFLSLFFIKGRRSMK